MSHLKNNYIFGILESRPTIWHTFKKIEALLIFDPLISLWGHFKAPYFKMLNDARVASACLCVRTCQRVRNSKNIVTIRDFHLPSSFFCLSTRLVWTVLSVSYQRVTREFFPTRNLMGNGLTSECSDRYSLIKGISSITNTRHRSHGNYLRATSEFSLTVEG